MKWWFIVLVGILALASVRCGGSGEPEPCSDDGAGAGGPGDVQVTIGAAVSAGSYGEACGPEGGCGYARKPDGEVCSCSLSDVERGERCAATIDEAEGGPVKNAECVPADESDYTCQWPEQPDQPDPNAQGACGYFAFCCYKFTFLHEFNVDKKKYVTSVYELMNIVICPRTQHPGAPETREGAMMAWKPKAMATYVSLAKDMIDGDGFVDAINCYDTAYDETAYACSAWPHNHAWLRP